MLHLTRRRKADAIPVLIFGEMRSGTNMLLACFNAAPSAEVCNETDDEAFLDYELRDLSTVRRLVQRSRASHVVFKPTADGNRANEVLDGLPGARGVWIFRSYPDVVNSALNLFKQHREYLQRIVDRSPTARWRATNLTEADYSLIETHLSRDLSEASIRALIWYLRNSFYFRLHLDRRGDTLLVNYEDLVKKGSGTTKRIFDFVGLRFRDRYVRHVTSASVGRRQPPEIDESIQLLCDGLLKKLRASCDQQTTIAL